MDYVFAIFGLGLVVTLVVAKGILQAHEFASGELEKQQAAVPEVEKPS
ncbi:MAG: hypothetical protein ABMA01_18570 [Chthoniobacteraceae bacterium]